MLGMDLLNSLSPESPGGDYSPRQSAENVDVVGCDLLNGNVDPGEPVTVEVSLENQTTDTISGTVLISLDGAVKVSSVENVGWGGVTTKTYEFTESDPGTYNVTVDFA